MERKAFRDYLRRLSKSQVNARFVYVDLELILLWVMTRQKRYDSRKGGLGKK